jgi:serine-type D-Ala-D-Ala carboxypeptidase
MKHGFVYFLFLMASVALCGHSRLVHVAEAQPLVLSHISPEEAGMDRSRLLRADSLIFDAITSELTPGAVLVVVRDSFIVYENAWGWTRRVPDLDNMQTGTIFDLASLTKPVATATAIMKLVETGHLRLTDPVSKYVPEYALYGGKELPLREQPRIIHLLTHTAGLPSYAPVRDLARSYGDQAGENLMTYLCSLPDPAPPGTQMTYSCPSFITLQKVVESVTGTDLNTWTRENIFEPLGMMDTFFFPVGDPLDKQLLERIAPTVYNKEEGIVAGIVHDPLAREVMAGVSGNAGLFSTAGDLAVFAAMMLNDGAVHGRRILSPATVRTMTTAPAGMEPFGRALGWDLGSSFASNQGDLFRSSTYGHTGYTGTSMVLDPETRTAVILLTNRVFPDDTTSVVDLRAKIANVVAASVIR